MKRSYIVIKGWKSICASIIARDGNVCTKCGLTNNDHVIKYKRRLTVNHINGDISNNSGDNLETLCLVCHARKDGRRTHIKKIIESKEAIIDLYTNEEHSMYKIAKIFKVSYETIQRALVDWNIPRRSIREATILAIKQRAKQRDIVQGKEKK